MLVAQATRAHFRRFRPLLVQCVAGPPSLIDHESWAMKGM
jgi:hypothetical protein